MRWVVPLFWLCFVVHSHGSYLMFYYNIFLYKLEFSLFLFFSSFSFKYTHGYTILHNPLLQFQLDFWFEILHWTLWHTWHTHLHGVLFVFVKRSDGRVWFYFFTQCNIWLKLKREYPNISQRSYIYFIWAEIEIDGVL